jgi:hypothetical protein
MANRTKNNSTQQQTNQPTAQLGVKKVVTTESYLEPIQEKPPAVQPMLVPQFIREQPPEEEPDKLETFLDNLENEQGLRLRVDLLTEYHVTGRSGRGAPYQFCGDMIVSKDSLLSESYLADVQALYGGGNFRFNLRGSNGRPITNWVKTIRTPAGPQNGTGPNVSLPYVQGQQMMLQAAPASPTDALDSFIEQAKKFEQLKKILGWNQEPQAATAAPAAPGVVAPEKTLEEKILEMMLNKAVDSGDEATVDKLVTRILGNEESETSWTSLIKEIIGPIVPMVVPLLTTILQAQTGQQAPAALPPVVLPTEQGSQTGPVDMESLPRVGPAAQQQSPEQQARAPINRLFQKITIDILEEYTTDASIEALYAFAEKYPHLKTEIDFLLDMTVEPATALQNLRIEPRPARLQWILDLRQDFAADAQRSIDETEEPQEPKQPEVAAK